MRTDVKHLVRGGRETDKTHTACEGCGRDRRSAGLTRPWGPNGENYCYDCAGAIIDKTTLKIVVITVFLVVGISVMGIALYCGWG